MLSVHVLTYHHIEDRLDAAIEAGEDFGPRAQGRLMKAVLEWVKVELFELSADGPLKQKSARNL